MRLSLKQRRARKLHGATRLQGGFWFERRWGILCALARLQGCAARNFQLRLVEGITSMLEDWAALWDLNGKRTAGTSDKTMQQITQERSATHHALQRKKGDHVQEARKEGRERGRGREGKGRGGEGREGEGGRGGGKGRGQGEGGRGRGGKRGGKGGRLGGEGRGREVMKHHDQSPKETFMP